MIHKETSTVRLPQENKAFEFLDQNISANDPFVFQSDRPSLAFEIKQTKDLLDKIRPHLNENPERHSENFITGLIQIGYLYQEKQNFKKAIEAFKEAKRWMKLSSNDKTQSLTSFRINKIRLNYNLGTIYPYIGKIRKGRKLLLECKNDINEINLSRPIEEQFLYDEIVFKEGLGDFYLSISKLPLARIYYNKALEKLKVYQTYDGQNNLRHRLILTYKISNLERIQDNTKKAYDLCKDAINQLSDLNSDQTDITEIKLYINILWIQLQLKSGDIESAMLNILDTEPFLNSLPNEIKSKHVSSFAKLCQELGDYFMLAQLIDNSKTFYHKAANLYQESPDYDHDLMIEHSSILNNLAAIYMDSQELEKVEKLLFKSLEIRKILFKEDPEEQVLDYAGTLMNLAIFYSDLGLDNETPRKLISESIALLTQFDPEKYDMDEEKYAQIMTRTLMTLDTLDNRQEN